MCRICRHVSFPCTDPRPEQVLAGLKVSPDDPLNRPDCLLQNWSKPHNDGFRSLLKELDHRCNRPWWQMEEEMSWFEDSLLQQDLSSPPLWNPSMNPATYWRMLKENVTHSLKQTELHEEEPKHDSKSTKDWQKHSLESKIMLIVFVYICMCGV